MLSKTQENKIALILFLIAIAVPLLLFNGTMDDFTPQHMAMIQEISNEGSMFQPGNSVIQVPGFYLYGAIITIVTGLTADRLINFPIQLIPYALLFFLIMYTLSENVILTSLVTLIELCSGSTGTGKIFFWPHGIGYILFFVMIALVFLLYRKKTASKPVILAAITGVSMVYISYNLTAMALLLLVSILFIVSIYYLYYEKNLNADKESALLIKKISFLTLIVGAAELGLSQFFYKVYIPTIDATRDADLTGFDKLSVAYLNPGISADLISSIMVSYPLSISIISVIKYAILGLALLAFCYLNLIKIRENKNVHDVDLFIGAVVLMSGMYLIPRVMIGGGNPGALWLPGIFCLARLPRLSKKMTSVVMVALSIILVCTSLYFLILDQNQLIDRDDHSFNGYIAPTQWLIKNTDGSELLSDVYTRNMIMINWLSMANPKQHYQSIVKNFPSLSPDDTLAITQMANNNLDKKYYILNAKLNRMSLQNWIIIQSWMKSEDRIESNVKINEIFQSSQVSIYCPSRM